LLPRPIYWYASSSDFAGATAHVPAVLTYIEVSAQARGIPDNFAFYLVSIANAASALGRVGSGFAADRFGAITVIVPFTALAGALTFAWPFVRSEGAFAGLAVVYGIGSGTFVALLVQPAIALGALDDVGRRVGTFMALLAAGALAGPPISGAILAATGGYTAVGAYAGSAVLVACAIMAAARYVVLGGWRGKF
jgi:MCP family monocarboxylic acid transporter-like MFS transporter 10